MTPMFPIALVLRQRRCVVVGDGSEAASRAQALADAGAEVLMVKAADYATSDLDAAWLCVLTDRNAELAARLGSDCEARQIFFCAVDQPSFGSFAFAGSAACFAAGPWQLSQPTSASFGDFSLLTKPVSRSSPTTWHCTHSGSRSCFTFSSVCSAWEWPLFFQMA